jgi:hypothetical protein
MNSLDAFAIASMEPIAWASLEINKKIKSSITINKHAMVKSMEKLNK